MFSPPATGSTPRLVLHPCAPDPFRETTTISMEIPMVDLVILRIVDARGEFVRMILSASTLKAGRYSCIWDGRDEAGRPVPAGDYYFRLEAGSAVETRKVRLLRD